MAAYSLFEQALAFYREPARFRDLKDTGLPLGGDAGPLLRLAGGASPEAVGAPAGLAESSEWLAAARFFVEQVLLAPGADFYRLHGVMPSASGAEIKERHRLLMRLVHPDREGADDTWQTAAAARINQAYATLRDPQRRAQYDSQREIAERQVRAAPAGPARPAATRRAAYRNGDTPLARYLWRHLPQVSLAGIALLALGWVGWIWLSNAPSAALGGGDDGGTIVALKGERPTPSVAPGEDQALPAASVASTAAPAPQAAPPAAGPGPAVAEHAPLSTTSERAAPAAPAGRKGLAAAVPIAPPSSTALAQRVSSAARPAATPQSVDTGAPAQAAAPTPLASAASASKPEPGPAAAPVAISAADTAAAPGASVSTAPAFALRTESALEKKTGPDPGNVISLLTQHYERGDLERFMALFHESARNDTGGRARIRKDYEELFAATASRQLIVWDMRWHPQGDGWKGEGSFQVRVQRSNEGFLRFYSGTLKIEMLAEGSQLLIRGLFHRLSNQSD